MSESSEPRKKTVEEAGAKGGRARAEKLSPAERKRIAKQAAESRWGAKLPVATHGSPDHPLKIGEIEIPCYVIEGGIRVITHRGLQKSLGMAQSGGAQRMAAFLGALESKGIDCKDLTSRISTPIQFKLPGVGSRAFGYEATVLADICDMILAAREAGVLNRQQAHIAAHAEIFVRGFARVGIIALVDEVTGYQYDRLRDDLRRILERYVSKELARYERVFEPDFYKHIYRLKGWDYNPNSTKRTHAVARLTVNLAYDRIRPDLLKELKQVRNEKGKASQKLHQWLTIDPAGGHPRLKQHAEGVTALLSVAKDWWQFEGWVDQRYPRLNQTMRLPFPDEEDELPPPPPANES